MLCLKLILILFIVNSCKCNGLRANNIREFIPVEAPENLTLVHIEDKEVLLRWDPVNPQTVRGAFRGYIVRIWNHGYSQVYALPPDVTQATVNFFPFSKNFVTVSARNDKFVGPRSTAISFDAPQTESNYPYLFEYYQLGPNSIFLQWNKPTQPNGILLGYKIYSSEMKDGGINQRTTQTYIVNDPEKFQAKVGGLKEGVRYQIALVAVNCAGESDQNTLEVLLEDSYSPAVPSIPYFKYKINHQDKHPQEICDTPDVPIMTAKPEPDINFDDFGDDYFMFNDTETGKIIRPKTSPKGDLIINSSPCMVNTMVTWIPDVGNNPGDHFYVKYRIKGEEEFKRTEPELDRDFIILDDFNACRSYEIILTVVDGEYSTDSYPQETPAVLFMFNSN